MNSVHILGICGSMRSISVTRDALEVALDGVRETGAHADAIEISDLKLPFCDGRQPEDLYPENVQRFRDLVRASTGIILATPEYHNSMTGALKNAIDLCNPKDFEGKMIGLIGIAGGAMGAIHAIDHMRTVMRGMAAWIVPHQVSVANADRIRGGIDDPAIRERLRKLGWDVACFAKLMAQGIIDLHGMEQL